jgi:hypothetical protein
LEKDELKFYYNGNKNYLLFQPATFHECGTLNVNDDSFVTMQVIPEKVSINTDNIRLIINNHTKEDIIYGTEFSLDYFDGQTWISVNLDILFENIGYILKPNESREQVLYLFPKYCTERGKYRIKKHLTLTDNSTKRKEYVICAEFEVY